MSNFGKISRLILSLSSIQSPNAGSLRKRLIANAKLDGEPFQTFKHFLRDRISQIYEEQQQR